MADSSRPVRTSISINHLLNSTTDSTDSASMDQPRQPSPRRPSPRRPSPRQPSPRQPSPRQPSPRQPSPDRSESSDVIEVTNYETDEHLLRLAQEASLASKHTTNCSELNPTMVIGTIPRTERRTNKTQHYCVRAVADEHAMGCFTIRRALDGTILDSPAEFTSISFKDIGKRGRFVGRFATRKWTIEEVKEYISIQQPPIRPSSGDSSQKPGSAILDPSTEEWIQTRPRRKRGEAFPPAHTVETDDESPPAKSRRRTQPYTRDTSTPLSAVPEGSPQPSWQPPRSSTRASPLRPDESSFGPSINTTPPPRRPSLSVNELWDNQRLHFEVRLVGHDVPFFFDMSGIHSTEELFNEFENEIGCDQSRHLRPEVRVRCEPVEVAPMSAFAILRGNPRGFNRLESFISRIRWDQVRDCKIIFELRLEE